MKRLCFFLVIILFVSSGCKIKTRESISTPKEAIIDSIEIVEKPYKNSTRIEYEIPIIRGTTKKHGMQKRYYLSGSIYSKIPYDNNLKQGIAYTYYQSAPGNDPQVWKEQPYVNDQLHGTCKRYHRDGTLQAEYEYKNGLPALGLQEYSESGKPLKQPALILTKKKVNDGYYITARLSEDFEKADYFVGSLEEGRYLPKNLKGLQVRQGLGEIVINKDSGRVTISALYFTRYHNWGLVSNSIQL